MQPHFLFCCNVSKDCGLRSESFAFESWLKNGWVFVIFHSFLQHCFKFYGLTPPIGPGPPHRCFTITLRHTTLGRIPLDEWSARCRDLYLTTQNSCKIHTYIHAPGGIPSHNPCKRAAVDHALGRAAIGIGSPALYTIKYTVAMPFHTPHEG